MKKPRKGLSPEAKLARIAYLEEKLKIQQGLPHLHGFPFYPWQRTFFESRNRYNFLVGANQLGKSTLLIRKCIEWATNTALWPELWNTKPSVFWYLYPNYDIATVEVEKKWIPDLLPRGEYKDHPKCGWTVTYDKKQVQKIDFNSGVSIYFKAYTQNPQHLQAGTVHAMWADEELPDNLFGELKSRISATNGYYHAGFTATLGQDFWRQILEDDNPRTNPLPNALKMQISLFDCQHFEDGTPSIWTDKKIEEEIRLCPNEREVQRRVYGKFVKSEGLKYPSFDRIKNVKPAAAIPNDWLIYAGIDIGSGSPSGGHPSAICFVAVRPDFRLGRIFKSWVGKGIVTTAADVLMMFQELRGSMRCAAQVYDYSARDFYTIASRAGESFFPADKSVEAGENTVNSLFKNELLVVDDIPENTELVRQFENLYLGEKKSKSVDDIVDCVRYISLVIPWDWQCITRDFSPTPQQVVKNEEQKRRDFVFGEDMDAETLFEEEIAEYNSLMEIN